MIIFSFTLNTEYYFLQFLKYEYVICHVLFSLHVYVLVLLIWQKMKKKSLKGGNLNLWKWACLPWILSIIYLKMLISNCLLMIIAQHNVKLMMNTMCLNMMMMRILCIELFIYRSSILVAISWSPTGLLRPYWSLLYIVQRVLYIPYVFRFFP